MTQTQLTEFGQRFKTVLLRSPWTHKDFANRMGTSSTFLSHVCYGRKPATPVFVTRVCDAMRPWLSSSDEDYLREAIQHVVFHPLPNGRVSVSTSVLPEDVQAVKDFFASLERLDS